MCWVNAETVYKISIMILCALIVWNVCLIRKNLKLIQQQRDAIRILESLMKSLGWSLERARKREEMLSRMIREEAEGEKNDDRTEDCS